MYIYIYIHITVRHGGRRPVANREPAAPKLQSRLEVSVHLSKLFYRCKTFTYASK